MRSLPTLTHRRIHTSRAPAALLGLSLAAMAACSAAFADNPRAAGPVTCEIALEPAGQSTRIIGRVHASQPASGSYEMAITSGRSGASTTIRQSGDFTLAAGQSEILGESQLPGGPSAHRVDLSVRVGGRALTCASL